MSIQMKRKQLSKIDICDDFKLKNPEYKLWPAIEKGVPEVPPGGFHKIIHDVI